MGKIGHEDRGINVYTRNILRNLGPVVNGCDVTLLHEPNSKPDDTFGIAGAHQEPLWFSAKHPPLRTILAEQILSPLQQVKLGLDVVWHPHNRGQFLTPTGYVCTMHDVLPLSDPELATGYLNSPEKYALYLSRTLSARTADAIITGSVYAQGEISKRLGVPHNRIHPIYHGIDRSIFNPGDKESSSCRPSQPNLPVNYVLTTGSYAPHKNLGILFEAYSQSGLPSEGVGLVMVGPNNATGYRVGYEDLQRRVARGGLGGLVQLLPSVPLRDLVEIYRNATIYACTSLHEGFGFTPLEAMACGVPVVASNITAIPEVCGDAALYANPREPVEFASHFSRLVNDPQLRAQFKERGFAQVLKYSWVEAADRTLKVLCAVAQHRRAPYGEN